jgi:Na+/H+ antiporter NhaD/arsenite permease-like protein
MDAAALHEGMDYFAKMTWAGSLANFAPFGLLLAVIACFPLNPRTSPWWEHNSSKALVAGACALAGILLYSGPTHDTLKLLDTLLEYLTFMALLASLYVVCGGIHITGAFSGLPYMNTLFLLVGALLANIMGTTGASMILIRPLIRANRLRTRNAHVVIFFIFIVSNAGGMLTPLGDPPLYLGFLRGVPFEWTFRLFPQWGLFLLLILTVFHFVDEIIFHREEKNTKHSLVEEITRAERKIHIEGWRNIFFLLALLGVIMSSGYLIQPYFSRLYGGRIGQVSSEVYQIILMIGITLMSYDLTAPRMYKARQRYITTYEKNEFSMSAILEVGILFFGIFGAMLPTMALLEAKGPSLAIHAPWQYFWGSGILSSFLDNAPTYLTFATLAASKSGVATDHLRELAAQFPRLLEAVACGSVFMGANTYIGNGPNFMVKTIAEQSKVKMPSFFGYMLWSLAILIPLFLVETFVFF